MYLNISLLLLFVLLSSLSSSSPAVRVTYALLSGHIKTSGEPLDRCQTEEGSSISFSSDHSPSTLVSFPFFVILVVSHPVIFSDSVLAFFFFFSFPLFPFLAVSMTRVVFSLPAFEVLISTSATRADNNTFASSFHIRLEWLFLDKTRFAT